MEGWSGRVDPSVSGDARRWHQVVRAVETSAPPGVVMLGFACDEGIRRNGGRVGAAAGPVALRSMLSNLPVLNESPLYDAGDVACGDGDLEGAQWRFAERIAQALDAGHVPVGLGGGHEIAFATYQGLARHLLVNGKQRYSKPRVAIINLDAHFDLRKQEQGSSGTPFLQAIEHAAQHGLALEYFCLGVSASANTRQLFSTADEHAVYYRHDDELTLLSLSQQIEALQSRLKSVDVIHLSICLDVLPAAMAPGVSAPSARGMPMEVIEPLLAAIAATGKIAVMDVAELSPPFDRDNSTARVAARLIHRVTHAIERAKSA
ncbi:formimidoylglutamase [Dyella tabacisoli]|uniref:Formimidoylglutamase n=2 Tax=Dyella tabacisoli TaxID=2282381 RepID=A0A369UTK9_9GAMM|nr:formimidoylglutamase [Dyella tabacisoli]